VRIRQVPSAYVLDVRVYRTAFLPALVALFIAAFALVDRPAPLTAPLPADAFSGEHAFGADVDPAGESLRGLQRDFPQHGPGTAGDRAMADRVARVFASPDDTGGKSPFHVTRMTSQVRTGDGTAQVQTVMATRPGLSNREIVVLADRSGPGEASLSATAGLLELARVLKTRDLTRTLQLVSTAGGTTGFGGVQAWAKANKNAPIDAVIVLGDLAGTSVHKPWVVSWPGSPRPVPLKLERTAQGALRQETKADPGGPRALGQWVRRALGVTVSGQGPLGAAGMPATLISASGERGPAAHAHVRSSRLERFGQAALRTVSAVDAAQPADSPAIKGPNGIITMRNVLPDWAVRLVIATLLLPALLAALDAFFRARRRRVPVGSPLRRLAAGAVGVLVVWLWLRLLGAIGVIPAADGPVLPDAFARGASAYAAAGTAVLAGAGLWYLARRASRTDAPTEGHAIAVGLAIVGLTAVVWVGNPYAAALLLPAAHAWPFAAGSWRWRGIAPAALAGLTLPLLAVLYLLVALGLNPLQLAWAGELAAAGGYGLWTALALSVVLAVLGGLLRISIMRLRDTGEAPSGRIQTRGPLSYAGPGSLGGTESALRR
jgi:hypothetical protein